MTDTVDLGKFLRPGDSIVWGQACGDPTTLVEALIAHAESIGRLSAFTATSFSGLLTAEAAQKFSLSSMSALGALRTVGAAIDSAAVLDTMSDDGTLTVGAARGHRVDRTFETVEGHRLASLRDPKGLVVVIAADVTGCHQILL